MISDRRGVERVVFDDAGIELTQFLAGSLTLAWSDLEFVSLTPALEKIGEARVLKPNQFDTGGHGAQLEFVVRDRRRISRC